MAKSTEWPELFMQNLPGLYGITRKEGKSTLVCARTEEEAVEKYNAFVKQFPHLNRQEETTDAVCLVSAIK